MVYIFQIIVTIDGYRVIVSDKKISCQTNGGNQIWSHTKISLDSCKKDCDSEPGCMFFRFSDHESSCHTFKSCYKQKQESANSIGSIYANSLSNNLFFYHILPKMKV